MKDEEFDDIVRELGRRLAVTANELMGEIRADNGFVREFFPSWIRGGYYIVL